MEIFILKSTCRQKDIDNLVNVKLIVMIKNLFSKNRNDIDFFTEIFFPSKGTVKVFKIFIYYCIPLL